MKFIKNVLLTFSVQLIAVILGIIISVILARTLGPEKVGIYSIIILIFTLLSTFGNLGIAISNTYYGVKKKYTWIEIASNSLISAFLLGTIILAALLLFYYFNPSLFENLDPNLLLIASITMPFILLMLYFQNILLGQNRIEEYNFTNITQSIIYLLLIVILILVVHGDLWAVIVSWTVSYVTASIIPVIMVYRSTKFKLHFNLNLFSKSVKFGLQSYLGNVIQFFNYRIDMFLIEVLLNFASVGYYSISVGLAESLWYLPSAVGTMVFARTPGLSEEERNESTPRVCRNTLFVTIILAIILFFTGKYIILILFGSQYLPALKPLWALIPGIIALSICKVLSNEITGRGKPLIITYASVISLIVNIPLNIIFIPQMGITGSALASSISYTAATLIVLAKFIKISKSTISETLIIKKQDIKLYNKFLLKIGEVVQIRFKKIISKY
jgi:O-antigen/teichoic acid export membrane protein